MGSKKIGNPADGILPNAPLLEVVFELRWGLPSDPDVPAQFRSDPGYALLAEKFTNAARVKGLSNVRQKRAGNMPGFLIPYSIELGFYEKETSHFPLWQIGPGVFSSNDSTGYDWLPFKKFTIDGLSVLMRSYPSLESFALKPVHIELRYIDSFDKDDFLKFFEKNTTGKINFDEFLPSKSQQGGPIDGSISLAIPIKDWPDTRFVFEVTSGTQESRPAMILQSKVITRAASIAVGVKLSERKTYFKDWLENAHRYTSPFFNKFVTDSLMAQFRRPNV